MGRTLTILATGVAAAVVITAAFLPGRQTIGGIQAGGQAVNSSFKGAEGIA